MASWDSAIRADRSYLKNYFILSLTQGPMGRYEIATTGKVVAQSPTNINSAPKARHDEMTQNRDVSALRAFEILGEMSTQVLTDVAIP
jgi:hypothetical protein